MKRFICSTLILLLIVATIPLEAFADEIFKDQPIFSIDKENIPSINPGDSKTIRFDIRNSGVRAFDIKLTPSIEAPFSSNSLTNDILIKDLKRDKKSSISLNLTVSEDAKPGSYPIKISFSYSYDQYEDQYDSFDEDDYYRITRERIRGSHEEIIYIKITDKAIKPQLFISKVFTEPEIINPGQKLNLNILFDNKGTIDADNVSVRLEGLNNDGGFYISSASDLNYVKKIPGGMISVTIFGLKAANNIKRGPHELEVVFKYGDQEERQKIYLTVGKEKVTNSNLLIENLEYPTGPTAANKDFVFSFDLKNNSEIDARDIIVRPEISFPEIIPKSLSIQKIDRIAPGEFKTLTFAFSPTDEAITRNYLINLIAEYEDEFTTDEDEKHLVNEYVGMYVVNKPKSDDDTTSLKGKPKLIIDKYNFQPQMVRAGENFEMSLSFFNTSSIKSVKNIKIFLTAEAGSNLENGAGSGSAFTPVDSSNTFYIDSIPPKGRVAKTITMFAVPDAIAKIHTITANFEYEDNNGNELKDEELIGVPVVQQSRLDVGEIGFMPESFIGESTPISLEFYNTGKVTLYNMMVKLVGDFQTENGQYYVGNFNSGSSEYFEGYIIPQEPGFLPGEVVFTYEDSTGQVQELRKDFSLNVVDMPPMEEPFPGEYPPDEGQGGIRGLLKNKIFWTLVAIIAIIAAAIIFKKRKKKKELSLDE